MVDLPNTTVLWPNAMDPLNMQGLHVGDRRANGTPACYPLTLSPAASSLVGEVR